MPLPRGLRCRSVGLSWGSLLECALDPVPGPTGIESPPRRRAQRSAPRPLALSHAGVNSGPVEDARLPTEQRGVSLRVACRPLLVFVHQQRAHARARDTVLRADLRSTAFLARSPSGERASSAVSARDHGLANEVLCARHRLVSQKDAHRKPQGAGVALSGEPASKGGCGSYSIASWRASATSRPCTRSVRARAMSIPADTPAPLMWLPCQTTRSATTSTPIARIASRNAQCVVVVLPLSSPAAAYNPAPVQTDAVHWHPGAAVRSHSTSTWSP